MNIQIVIAQRGWVFVGDIVTSKENVIAIEKCKNIRRWGTSKGLGQLAIDGPQYGTVLDECGIVTLHPLAVVACIACDATKWKL